MATKICIDLDLKKTLGGPAAAVLNHILFWEPKAKYSFDGVPWVYKSYDDLKEELGYAQITIRRAIRTLLEHNLILKERKWAKAWKQTNFYRVNQQALAELKSTFQTTPKRANQRAQNEQLQVLKMNTSSIDPEITNSINTPSTERAKITQTQILEEKDQTEQNRLATDPKLKAQSVTSFELPPKTILTAKKNTPRNNFDVEKLDKNLLRWLRQRAESIGNIYNPYAWAFVVAQQMSPDLQTLYERYRQGQTAQQARIAELSSEPSIYAVSEASSPLPQPLLTPEDHLARLQTKWNFPMNPDRHRKEVLQQITDHPEWGLVCDPNLGPVLRKIIPLAEIPQVPARLQVEHRPTVSELELVEVSGIASPSPAILVPQTTSPDCHWQENSPGDQVDLSEALVEITVLRDFLGWCNDQFSAWLWREFKVSALSVASDSVVLAISSRLRAMALA